MTHSAVDSRASGQVAGIVGGYVLTFLTEPPFAYFGLCPVLSVAVRVYAVRERICIY